MSRFILSAFADEIDPMLDVQMDVLEQHGISYIEMRGVNGKGLVDYPLGEVRKLKKQLDKRGFKISSIGSPIGKILITEDFCKHLELFRHTLEIARIMGTSYIRMFSFYIPEGSDPSIYRDEVMERWSRFIEAAAGSGIILLHENEKGIYGDTASRCLDLLETMNCSYFKAVFDPANFVQCSEVTYPYAFKMLKKYIVYLHIKDALYKDHSVVPSGCGDGRVKDILSELKKDGFEGFASLEPHLADFTGFSDLEKGNSFTCKSEDSGSARFAVAKKALDSILESI